MKFALLGNPVAHSKSPVFQNAGLDALGIDGVYETRQVDEQGLAAAAKDMRFGALAGCNITLPHKEAAFQLADSHSSIAGAMGAANTWVRVGDTIRATNTDVFGVRASVAALQRRASPSRHDVTPSANSRKRRVVVLGAGGAAAAAAAALVDDCESLVVVNRSRERAKQLCASLGQRPSLPGATACETWAITWDEVGDDVFADVDLIVQGTSLPVLHQTVEAQLMQSLPWAAAPASAALLELCYASEPTAAMRAAMARKLAVADGACMLLHQGAASLALWTNRDPPLAVMRDALAAALSRDSEEIPLAPMGADDWRRLRDAH